MLSIYVPYGHYVHFIYPYHGYVTVIVKREKKKKNCRTEDLAVLNYYREKIKKKKAKQKKKKQKQKKKQNKKTNRETRTYALLEN